MQSKHNRQLVPLAKQPRKQMTKEDRHLWYDFLRAYPIRFSRQKVPGKYFADFYCAEAKLVIELDGSQHYEGSNKGALGAAAPVQKKPASPQGLADDVTIQACQALLFPMPPHASGCGNRR